MRNDHRSTAWRETCVDDRERRHQEIVALVEKAAQCYNGHRLIGSKTESSLKACARKNLKCRGVEELCDLLIWLNGRGARSGGIPGGIRKEESDVCRRSIWIGNGNSGIQSSRAGAADFGVQPPRRQFRPSQNSRLADENVVLSECKYCHACRRCEAGGRVDARITLIQSAAAIGNDRRTATIDDCAVGPRWGKIAP